MRQRQQLEAIGALVDERKLQQLGQPVVAPNQVTAQAGDLAQHHAAHTALEQRQRQQQPLGVAAADARN